MMRQTRARSLTALTFVTALSIAPLPVVGQEAAPSPLAIQTARVTIEGTSNVHPYSASTTTVRLTRAVLGHSVAGADFWDRLVAPGGLQAFDIAVPAATLSSAKDGLDKNMHKALKTQVHPDITFRLIRLEAVSGGSGALRGIGMLQIAGVEREIALSITVDRHDSTISVKGDVQLLMTDFGITPPKAMLGMLKTDPKVTVRFETVLAISLT